MSILSFYSFGCQRTQFAVIGKKDSFKKEFALVFLPIVWYNTDMKYLSVCEVAACFFADSVV